jgi:hypothetical protein
MEPIADSEIKRVLVINAHPDDSDFGASGTIAQWVAKGIEVSYASAPMVIKVAKNLDTPRKRCQQCVNVNNVQPVQLSESPMSHSLTM